MLYVFWLLVVPLCVFMFWCGCFTFPTRLLIFFLSLWCMYLARSIRVVAQLSMPIKCTANIEIVPHYKKFYDKYNELASQGVEFCTSYPKVVNKHDAECDPYNPFDDTFRNTTLYEKQFLEDFYYKRFSPYPKKDNASIKIELTTQLFEAASRGFLFDDCRIDYKNTKSVSYYVDKDSLKEFNVFLDRNKDIIIEMFEAFDKDSDEYKQYLKNLEEPFGMPDESATRNKYCIEIGRIVAYLFDNFTNYWYCDKRDPFGSRVKSVIRLWLAASFFPRLPLSPDYLSRLSHNSFHSGHPYYRPYHKCLAETFGFTGDLKYDIEATVKENAYLNYCDGQDAKRILRELKPIKKRNKKCPTLFDYEVRTYVFRHEFFTVYIDVDFLLSNGLYTYWVG